MQDQAVGAQWAARWVAAMQRRAVWVLLAALVVGAALAVLIARHLSVDTSTANLLSPQLPWRQARAALDARFPSVEPPLAVVIDAADAATADAAQQTLVAAMQARGDLFRQVLAAETEPFFRRNGLLYLDLPQLEKLADGLNRAQPFLGTLGRDPSLRGLSSLLVPALRMPDTGAFDLTPVFGALAQGVDAAAQQRAQPVSWQALAGGDSAMPGSSTRRFIAATPQPDPKAFMPAAAAIGFIRDTVHAQHLDTPGLSVRITGAAALEHEELLAAFSGTGIALASALVLVMALLWMALRSLRLVASAVITLVYGLLATAGFAALAVGHLNLISIAFGLLYVGLGIDYALYLCLQYRERRAQAASPQALQQAAGDVGGFMLVCALTTSVGFFAFIPTSFDGIGELGLIAGVGMFVSLAVSLTLLPALIALMPPRAAAVPAPRKAATADGILSWPYRHARPIWLGAAALAVGALLIAPRARFDYDPLNVRDPASESVSTFRDLLRDPALPPLTLSVLAPDAAAAQAIAHKLAALPAVSRAFSLGDLVPRDQDDKLPVIEDLALSLDLPPVAEPQPVSTADEIAASRSLREALRERAAGLADAAAAATAMHRLAAALQALETAAAGSSGDAVIRQLHANLFGAMPAQLASLRLALQAAPVAEADLPPAIAQRYHAADGTYRVEVWPRAALDTPQAMQGFVDAVRALEPGAVGPPVEFIEAGRTVVQAFREAFAYSLAAVVLLLLVVLRSLRDMLLVLVPLLLAGACTVAAMVLLGQPFNFANVVALPLVLGVGVDYGVYLVQRGRAAPAGTNLLQTGTARAVWYGALITIANFGNLMLATHRGMASMGLLLTIGLLMTLLCTLVLLPSLLARGR